ncbi:Uncharacterized protein TCM_036576 [Theobroma cacao]|uniref:Uncharacterized protein n=1 Tax=Theobroma cacao TaxID=3641 RepID=A0A061FJZ9_THECC|nr:Uncharacterized protein TCM_036576 [Theobroma cacao]
MEIIEMEAEDTNRQDELFIVKYRSSLVDPILESFYFGIRAQRVNHSFVSVDYGFISSRFFISVRNLVVEESAEIKSELFNHFFNL